MTTRLHDRVRLDIEYKGQTADFVKTLASLFQGSGLDRKSLEKIVNKPEKLVDGADIAQSAREGADAFASDFGLSSAKANQAVAWLNEDPARLYELELSTCTFLATR